jgi:hypothetical protein
VEPIRPVPADEAEHDVARAPVEFTSWSRESNERWNAFRAAVLAGVTPGQAAHGAGLEPLEVTR